MRTWVRIACVAAALVGVGQVHAEIPPALEAQLLYRTLAYNRRLAALGNTTLVVSVITKPGGVEPHCMAMKQSLQQATPQSAAQQIKVGYMAFMDAASFTEAIKKVKPHAIYVCKGLDQAVPSISEISRQQQVMTFASSRSMLQMGLSIAFDEVKGKPGVVVNLRSVKAEGADMDAALLQVSEVMR